VRRCNAALVCAHLRALGQCFCDLCGKWSKLLSEWRELLQHEHPVREHFVSGVTCPVLCHPVGVLGDSLRDMRQALEPLLTHNLAAQL
jgi:hypothetical protein